MIVIFGFVFIFAVIFATGAAAMLVYRLVDLPEEALPPRK